MRAYTVAPPAAGRLIHLGTMRAGQRMMTRTACGRWIEASWITTEIFTPWREQVTAAISCTACARKASLLFDPAPAQNAARP